MEIAKEYKLLFALTDNIILKNNEEEVIYALIEESANDKNSSKFREDVTKWLIGRKSSESKHGHDDDKEAIEVKPTNFTGNSKLTGGGNYSDLTWERHIKYIEDNVQLFISGFHYGKLLYIIELRYAAIKDHLEKQLLKKLPNGDVPTVYVRNAAFSYLHWKDGPYKIVYLRDDFHNYQSAFNKKFFKLLKNNTDDIAPFAIQGQAYMINSRVLSANLNPLDDCTHND